MLQDSLWCCPTPGCVRVYARQSWLEKHRNKGDHVIPHVSSLLQRAADKAESILFASFAPPTPGSKFNVRSTAVPNLNVMAVSDPVKPGWALSAWSKPIQRKRQKVVKWLTDLFESGEKSGRKTKPAAAQALMKTLRNDQNALAFTVEERLSKSQIQSWFSAYARERKARMAVLHAIEQTDTNASNKGKNS